MVGQTLTASGIPAGDTIHSCNAGNTTTIGTVCTSNIQLTSNATGASTTMTVATTPLSIGNGTYIDGTKGVRFDGAVFSYSGISLATGDVNGDGYADLVIGAEVANGGNGYTYVVFGKSATWGSAGNIVLNTGSGNLIDGTQGFRLDGATAIDSGGEVATGDLNGDGIKDIIIDAYNANSAAGYVYTYFGHKNMIQLPWPNPNLSLGGL